MLAKAPGNVGEAEQMLEKGLALARVPWPVWLALAVDQSEVGQDFRAGAKGLAQAVVDNPGVAVQAAAGWTGFMGGTFMTEAGAAGKGFKGVGPAGIVLAVSAPVAAATGVVIAGAGAGMAVPATNKLLQEAADNAKTAKASGSGTSGQSTKPVDQSLDAQGVKSAVRSQTSPAKNSGVRVFDSEQELQSLYDQLSRGGKSNTPPTYGGQSVKLSDGTTVGIRSSSTSG